jgi:nitroreductase
MRLDFDGAGFETHEGVRDRAREHGLTLRLETARPPRARCRYAAAIDTFLAIVSKREVRDYADRDLPDDVVRRILEAGRLAGSAVNKQPWRFVAIRDRELLDLLAETVYAADNLRGARLAIAIVVSDSPGFDCGRAAQNMMLAAWNEGVGSCPNGMPDPQKAAEALGLPDGERPLNILSFGYPAKPRDPESRSPEEWVARANRKPFDEVVELRW